MRHPTGIAIAIFAGFLMLANPPPLFAAITTAETVLGVTHGTLGTIPFPSAQQDIVSATRSFDDTYQYFTINIAGTLGAGAEGYGIMFIGGSPAGSGASKFDYYSDLLKPLNIDAYMKVTYTTFPGYTVEDKYINNAGNILDLTVSNFTGSGSQLEWKIAKTQLASSFSWLAVSLDGVGHPLTDRTGVAVTPIPNAVWLFGSGIVALVGLKRRKSKA